MNYHHHSVNAHNSTCSQRKASVKETQATNYTYMPFYIKTQHLEVSREKHNIQLCLVLYLSYCFSYSTHSSALLLCTVYNRVTEHIPIL